MDIAQKIALLGITVSAVFAIIGLFLNFLALRKSNRITVSTKLTQVSKVLTDELVATCRSYQLYGERMKTLEESPESEQRTKAIEALSKLIKNNLARQNEIDQQGREIDRLFKHLDSVDPGDIDETLSDSYRRYALASSGLDLAEKLNDRNAEQTIQ